MDIREIRKSLGMTQQEFADAIGVDKSVVCRYESGRTNPSKKTTEKIDYLVSRGDVDLQIEQDSTPDDNTRLNHYIRRLVIQGANGHCELCGESAPFLDRDGRPYLLLHFIDSNPSVDIAHRSVVLCPNCKARINILKKEEDIKRLQEAASKHNY